MININKDVQLVYSTDSKLMNSKSDSSNEGFTDGFVRVRRETKGRKGAGVVTVSGIPEETSKVKEIAKRLKKRCGTGGSVKNDVIEIQGDKKDLIKSELEAMGYKVKFSGG